VHLLPCRQQRPAIGSRVVRLMFELLRPVPLAQLAVTSDVLRAGRRVQLLGASLHAGDDELCRATAVTVREAPGEGGPASAPAPPPAPPSGGRELPGSPTGIEPSFVAGANEIRFLAGSSAEPGPATAWF